MRSIEMLLYAALVAVAAEARIDGLVAGRPTAADPCGTHSTFTNFEIATTADRDLVAECTEIYHHLFIDQDYPSILSLPKLTSVLGITVGDISDEVPSEGLLTGLSFPSLVNASDISVTNLVNITLIDVPKLTYNDKQLLLIGLLSLESYNGFESVRKTECVKIDTTGLKKINYGNLENASVMSIWRNPSLSSVELPAANIGHLGVYCYRHEGNGSSGVHDPLPRFSGPSNAKYILVSSCGTPLGDPRTAFGIKTMISETADNGGLNFGFKDNTFSSIGFPNLTRIDGMFSLIYNDELSDFVFPALRTVNGRMRFEGHSIGIINQTTFPVLANVSDGLSFSGNITDVTLPDTLVNAPVVITSTNSKLDCSKFSSHAVNATGPTKTGIQVVCENSTADADGPEGSGSGSSSTSSGFGGPRLSGESITGLVVGSISSLATFVLIL